MSKRVSKIKCIFVTQNMQDNNEWFTWLFIVEKEAPKRKLVKRERERERTLIKRSI